MQTARVSQSCLQMASPKVDAMFSREGRMPGTARAGTRVKGDLWEAADTQDISGASEEWRTRQGPVTVRLEDTILTSSVS